MESNSIFFEKDGVTYKFPEPDECIKLLKLLKRSINEETDLGFPPVNDWAALQWIMNVCYNGFVVIAVTGKGQIIGSAGFSPSKWPWSAQKQFFNNDWLYVAPEFRKERVAETIIEISKQEAKKINFDLVVGIMMGKKAELKERLLKMQGMKYAGGFMLSPSDEIEGEVDVRLVQTEN